MISAIILIGILAVVGVSIGLIFSSIEDQQELSEINQDVAENQMQMIQESTSVTVLVQNDDQDHQNPPGGFSIDFIT